MNVDKVSGIGNSGYEPKKSTPVQKQEIPGSYDNITISDAAKIKANESKIQAEVQAIAKKIIHSGEEIERTEKIKEIKSKLKNGDYDNISPEMLDKMAEKLTDIFLG